MIKKLLKNPKIIQLIKYGIFGVMTTIINLTSFYLLERIFLIHRDQANLYSILIAIFFAYLANKFFVFDRHRQSIKELLAEICSFFLSRAVTLVMEIIGVYLFTEWGQVDSMVSKGIVTILVIITNYFFTKKILSRQQPANNRVKE